MAPPITPLQLLTRVSGYHLTERGTAPIQIKFIEIPAEVEGNPHNPYVTEGLHEYATGFGGHVAEGKGDNFTSMF